VILADTGICVRHAVALANQLGAGARGAAFGGRREYGPPRIKLGGLARAGVMRFSFAGLAAGGDSGGAGTFG